MYHVGRAHHIRSRPPLLNWPSTVVRSGLNWCAVKLAEWYLPTALNFADLTLATSPQLKDQLKELGCRNVEVCVCVGCRTGVGGALTPAHSLL